MIKMIFSLILALIFAGVEIDAQQPSPSPESKTRDEKNLEEYRQKVAEVEEKNKQISENNRKIAQALMDGSKAFQEKNYQLAIEKFDEGYRLDPDFWGTAPILLNNKAIALTQLGAEVYNRTVKTDRDPKIESNQFILEAILALKKAQEILENTDLPKDEASQRQIANARYVGSKQLAECYRLLALTDETRIYEAITAIENYIEIEPDAALKARAKENLRNLKSKYKIGY